MIQPILEIKIISLEKKKKKEKIRLFEYMTNEYSLSL